MCLHVDYVCMIMLTWSILLCDLHILAAAACMVSDEHHRLCESWELMQYRQHPSLHRHLYLVLIFCNDIWTNIILLQVHFPSCFIFSLQVLLLILILLYNNKRALKINHPLYSKQIHLQGKSLDKSVFYHISPFASLASSRYSLVQIEGFQRDDQ